MTSRQNQSADNSAAGGAPAPSGGSGRTGPRYSATARGAFLGLVAVLTLGASWLVGRQVWHIGIRDEWVWRYYEQPGQWLLAAPVIAFSLVMALVLVKVLQRPAVLRVQRISGLCIILALSLAIILSQADIGGLAAEEPVYVTAVPWTGGYYPQSIEVGPDIASYLKRYPDLMQSLPIKDHRYAHLADHPVGPVLFHWLVNRALESSPALVNAFTPGDPQMRQELHFRAQQYARLRMSPAQFAGIYLSAFLFRFGAWLALIPVYFLAREFHSHEVGLIAVALSAVIPSLNLFTPYPDQLLALFAVGAFTTWYLAVKNRSMAWSTFSALIMFLGLQFSLSLLTAGAVMALASVLMLVNERKRGERLEWAGWLRIGAAWVAAFLLVSLLCMFLFGYDVWSVWRICLSKHATFAAQFGRSYVSWVLFNPVEFLLFTGVPISLLMIYAAVADIRRRRSCDATRVAAVLPWSLIGAWLLLNISGKSLGEGARLWMFLMPFAAVSAAGALRELDRRRGWIAAGVLLLCVLQMIVFRLNLFVFRVV